MTTTTTTTATTTTTTTTSTTITTTITTATIIIVIIVIITSTTLTVTNINIILIHYYYHQYSKSFPPSLANKNCPAPLRIKKKSNLWQGSLSAWCVSSVLARFLRTATGPRITQMMQRQNDCVDLEDMTGWKLVLKIGKTDKFGFSSKLWTNSELLNADSPMKEETDAKYDAFNKVNFKKIRMCIGYAKANCVQHNFDYHWDSARQLFSSGYIRDASVDQEGILKTFGPRPGSYRDCPMQRRVAEIVLRFAQLVMDSGTVCPGLASTSSARMATKLVGAIAITAPARVAKSRTATMLTQPSASALRVRAQKGRWEPVGQSGVAACSSG